MVEEASAFREGGVATPSMRTALLLRRLAGFDSPAYSNLLTLYVTNERKES